MEIKGHFVKTIYHNESNGYTVALFEYEEGRNKEEIYAVGILAAINYDRLYTLKGDFIDHPKYGIQFSIESYERLIEQNSESLIHYFSSEQFVGIGKKFATTLVDALGLNLIERIKADSSVLDTVEKMTAKRKAAILEGLEKEMEDDVLFLSSHHLTMPTILKLKNRYGDDTLKTLAENPYQPIEDIDGIGFATMDKFALDTGTDKMDRKRLCAYSETVLMNLCMRNGDSYLLLDEFKRNLAKELGEEADIEDIISYLLAHKRIAMEEERVYPISQYNAENYIASYLQHFPFEKIVKIKKEEVEEQLKAIEQRDGISYQDKQLEAIASFFSEDGLIITGGPGTGKTTIVRAIIELAQLLYPMHNITLIAPTGRAAKRMSELTLCEAKTVHSLLLWDKETGRFAKNEDNPLTCDIVIIDEFSMVDTYLFYNLLKAGHSIKKLVMIGDADQLPSVAMGALLRDLIESGVLKVIALDKIYRQKEGSDIISLAYQIKNDLVEDIPQQQDIRFFECAPAQIRDVTLQVVEHALSRYSSLEEGFMKVQVLSPKHNGINGINALNNALQSKFNPPEHHKKELQVGYRIFREQDKVLQLKNQPDDDVFNGDIGIIEEIIYAREDMDNQNRIIANFDGHIVEYTSESFANLTHAYCMSVHKAQGSEYPIVIMPLDLDYGIMLQKRLIYTAVTRAYRNLILIGEKSAFFRSIHQKDIYERHTTLKERLIERWENDDDKEPTA